MAAPVRAVRPSGGSDPGGRLAFLEAAAATDGVGECAQLAVDHLHRHAHIERVVCASSAEPDGPLVGMAGRGVNPGRIAALTLDLESHAGGEGLRALLRDGPRQAQLPFLAGLFAGGRCTVTPAPLTLARAELPMAILFTSIHRSDEPELVWTAGVLARQLARCRQVVEVSQSRRRLERERAFLQRILTAFPDPVLLTDLKCRLLAANPRAEHYFATQDGESDGRRRAVALNNMLFSAGLSSTTIEGTEAVRRELPLVDPTDGSDRLFELLSSPIATPDGAGILSVLRNVTDLQLAAHEIAENYRKIRIAEADVRAERDRLDLVIDSVGAPILVTDPNGALALMNAPAERLFTASARAAAEELPRVRANHAHFSSHVSNVFFGSSTARVRGELGLADPQTGEPAPVEAVSGKVLSEHGEVTAVVSILHDLREAKEKQELYERLKLASGQLEQKVRDATAELVRQNELLRRQHIELEQASNLKSQFLATMSHEFRTPLNAILGYTSILRENIAGDLNPGQARSVSRIDSNAHQLLTIINDILDISRIEAGSMPTHLGTFELPELIAEVLAEVEPLIARSRVAVSTRIRRGLPKMRSDRAKVKQILVNLIANALKFTANGSVVVSCAPEKGSRQVAMSVADTGIGIATHDLETIFEDFRQADNSPTRQYGGAGLGLAICRRLARVLGGQISVVSLLGHGSTFRLTLPWKPRS